MSEYIGNRYRIINLLGKGGMADVYLGYDEILKREVAIKILKADMSDDDIALERFKREAGAVTQLSHPNIVDVYDVGDDGDKHYIVMEYVRGYTLKQLIKKRGPIPYKEAVWLMKQLAGALMEAHRNGVIHRDVKSQNVLIKDDGTVKLSDFGIAVASGAIQLTHKDSVLGSVHYLAPELSRGRQATMQSDIYSLGIVFYELLTGDVPFKAETPVQVALRHIKENVPSVRQIDPSIPQSVENIIIRSTAKSLNNRYKNIALMLQDLNECLKPEHQNDRRIVFGEPTNNPKDVHISEVAKKTPEKKSVIPYIFIGTISVFSIVVLMLVLYFSGIIGGRNKPVVVPDLTNMTVQEAKDVLAKNNLEVDDSKITWTLSDNIEKDLIISSSPASGEEIEKGSKIKLTVSSGIYSILDNYVGQDYKDAQKKLMDLNFKVKLLPIDSEKQAGEVVEQSLEPGYKYDASMNNEIVLKYSKRNSIVLSYELMGMDIDDAVAYFESYNIDYSLSLQPREFFNTEEILDTAVHTVIRMEPSAGSTFTHDNNERVVVYYYDEENQGEQP